MESVTSEIASKVDKMKKELNNKAQTVKQLKLEFERIHVAKERRIEKCRVTLEGKLNAVREQNHAAALKLDDLYQRLQSDVQKLSDQAQSLEDRMRASKAQQMEAIENTKRDAQKRLVRAKRQWEADENVSLEKVVKSKAELLQKQAADSFGPKLDKLVKDGKLKVSQVRDDGELKLQKLQLSLQAEHEKKVSDCKDKLTEQIVTEIEKVKRALQRQQEEVTKSQHTEIATLQDKYAREKVALTETFDRSARIETEQSQEALQSISKREVAQTQELMEKQQREISYLIDAHNTAMHKLKQSLREQQEVTQQKAVQLTAALRNERLERRKQAITRKLATETQNILQKLREDAQIERQRIQEGFENRIDSVRVKVQTELDTKQEQHQR